MLHIKDPLFLATTSMIEGSGEMPPIFQHLADWTHQHMDVTILNIAYHRAEANAAPRLVLVLDTAEDYQRACRADRGVKREFVSFIRNTLGALAPQLGIKLGFSIDSLDVEVEAFALTTYEDVIERALSHGKIALLQKLSRYNVYDIRQNGSETIIVYYTEFSQEASETSGDISEIRRIYCAHLAEYDNYGYCIPEKILLSSENLEEREDRTIVAFEPRLPAAVEATYREPVYANRAPSIFERMTSLLTMARALVL